MPFEGALVSDMHHRRSSPLRAPLRPAWPCPCLALFSSCLCLLGTALALLSGGFREYILLDKKRPMTTTWDMITLAQPGGAAITSRSPVAEAPMGHIDADVFGGAEIW